MPTEEKQQNVLNGERIGERIRLARKKRKLTQDQLSEKCKCTPTHISNIENGKIGISLSLLFSVSIVLEEQLDYFVMDCDGVNPKYKTQNLIAPKLNQCDSEMLKIVDGFLDSLLSYREYVGSKLLEHNNDKNDYKLSNSSKADSIWI